MNETILDYIKNEKRENLGKRFKKWIANQWGYEYGSWNTWIVSEERAITEITESILLDPKNEYFLYKDNKLISLTNNDRHVLFQQNNYIDSGYLNIDIIVFKEILRDYRLKYILKKI